MDKIIITLMQLKTVQIFLKSCQPQLNHSRGIIIV